MYYYELKIILNQIESNLDRVLMKIMCKHKWYKVILEKKKQ